MVEIELAASKRTIGIKNHFGYMLVSLKDWKAAGEPQDERACVRADVPTAQLVVIQLGLNVVHGTRRQHLCGRARQTVCGGRDEPEEFCASVIAVRSADGSVRAGGPGAVRGLLRGASGGCVLPARRQQTKVSVATSVGDM